MATRVIHVSDVSGTEADERELGQLVIHQHPGYNGLPVTLEVLPEEMESLRGADRFARVEWVAPGARHGQELIVGLDDLENLGSGGALDQAIANALAAKNRGQSPARGGGRGRSGAASKAPAARSGRTGVSYATLDHAGEPHRGRITEREKEIVRENLDQVNKRLAETGYRQIDLADPDMQRRYGV